MNILYGSLATIRTFTRIVCFVRVVSDDPYFYKTVYFVRVVSDDPYFYKNCSILYGSFATRPYYPYKNRTSPYFTTGFPPFSSAFHLFPTFFLHFPPIPYDFLRNPPLRISNSPAGLDFPPFPSLFLPSS